MRKAIRVLFLVLALCLALTGSALASHCYVDSEEALRANFRCLLDGVEYQMPIPMSELAANGWTLSETGTLDAMTYSLYPDLLKGDATIDAIVLNPTQEALAMEDSWIGELTFDLDYEKQRAAASMFSLPNGVTVDSTAAEVLAAFNMTFEPIAADQEVTGYNLDGSTSVFKPGEGYCLFENGIMLSSFDTSSLEKITYLSLDYVVTAENQSPSFNNNTMKVGENMIEFWFDRPINEGDGRITKITFKLMA